MSDMQSMIFLQKLMKKYSGHTLNQQILDKKSRRGMFGDNEKRFAGILPKEHLKSVSHNLPEVINDQLEQNPSKKEDEYIKSQYHKRSNLIKEVDVNKMGNNSK